MAAAGTALMLLSGAVPIFTYAAPLLASLFLCPVCSRAGNRIAAAVWVITAGLSLLLGADKEAAFFYLFFGWYPIVKPLLDRIGSKGVRIAVKTVLFAGLALVMLVLTVLLLGIGESVTGTPGLHMLDLAFLAAIVLCMLLFDKALEKLMPLLLRLTEKLLK